MNPGVWVTPGKSGDGSRYLEAEKDIDETTGMDHSAKFRFRNRH